MSGRPGRALVIGASGVLGSRLLALAPRDLELTGTGNRRPVREGPWRAMRLDVSFGPEVVGAVAQVRPEAVVYLAYHPADRSITVDGAQAAAQTAAMLGARFLFVSTDLVFDGERAPYNESVPAQPVMPYGQMKLEAEVAVKDAHPAAVVLRPALMAGQVGTTLYPQYEGAQLTLGMPLHSYVDEWRTPVMVDDVARAVWGLVLGEVSGTFHLGGPERMSRHQLALKVCELMGFDATLVREARRPADRPKDTSLDSKRLADFLGWSPTPIATLAAGIDLARV